MDTVHVFSGNEHEVFMADAQPTIHDVERDIMSRPSERNTTNLDLKRMKMILDLLGDPQDSFRIIHILSLIHI